MGARRPANLLFISSATRCHLTLSQIFWDRIQPETFWLAGRKPWPATVFLIRDYPIFFCIAKLPKELCVTGMASCDLLCWHVSKIAWHVKILLHCNYFLPRFWQFFSLGSSRKLASSWMHSELTFFVVFSTTCSCEKTSSVRVHPRWS